MSAIIHIMDSPDSRFGRRAGVFVYRTKGLECAHLILALPALRKTPFIRVSYFTPLYMKSSDYPIARRFGCVRFAWGIERYER